MMVLIAGILIGAPLGCVWGMFIERRYSGIKLDLALRDIGYWKKNYETALGEWHRLLQERK